jgi:alanine racemase
LSAPASIAAHAPPDALAEAGAILTVDLGALAANWRLLRDRTAPAECAAVVKADAYGIGIEPALGALSRAGCRTFFVADLSEARRVRKGAPDAVVYVLNGLLPGTAERYAIDRLRPVLGSLDEIGEWAGFCRTAGRNLPAALHVDTGMNRLGLEMEAAAELARSDLFGAFAPSLLMSHLVAAEQPDHPCNARQLERFRQVTGSFPGVPASLANSSGIFLPQAPHFDLARPGYALYGGNPTPLLPNPMRPVVRLEARIIQVRDIAAGEAVGYRATWTAPAARRVATLSVGYGDGYPRTASGTDSRRAADMESGVALVAGRGCPFLGLVSMDLIVIDVTDVPAEKVRRGDVATLIGDGLTLDEVGRRAGTIGYEILTGLGRRYARLYTGRMT